MVDRARAPAHLTPIHPPSRRGQVGATTAQYIVLAAVLVLGLVVAWGMFRGDIAAASDAVGDDIVTVAGGGSIDRDETLGTSQSALHPDPEPPIGPSPYNPTPGGGIHEVAGVGGDAPSQYDVVKGKHTFIKPTPGRLHGFDTLTEDGKLTQESFDSTRKGLRPEKFVGVGTEVYRLEDDALLGGRHDFGDHGHVSGELLGYKDVKVQLGGGYNPDTGTYLAGVDMSGEVFVGHGQAEVHANLPGSNGEVHAQGDVYLGRVKGDLTVGIKKDDKETFVGLSGEIVAESVGVEAKIGGSLSALDVGAGIFGPLSMFVRPLLEKNDTVRNALESVRVGADCKGSASGPSAGGKVIAGGYHDREKKRWGLRAGAQANAGLFGLGVQCGGYISF